MIPFLLGFCLSASSFVTGESWKDDNSTFIQAHSGNVQWLPDIDCFNDGFKGCWVWYGEDRVEKGNVRCYVSKDLYNWVNKGIVLFDHNIMPEQLDINKTRIELNNDNLDELKRRANMKTPEMNITDKDIKVAHDFLKAYVTEVDKDGKYIKFDEELLASAFRNLFNEYNLVLRPKVVHNKKNNNYVMTLHSDGPKDADVVSWIKKGMPNGTNWYSYARANLGFAVSQNPFGPFKVVNIQRMHWVKGYYDKDKGMSRDQTIFVDDDEKAYVIYASEDNHHMYISRLNEDYLALDVPQEKAVDGVDFKARIISAESREAPAMFRDEIYYYLITSDTTYYVPNAARWHRASSILGPYEEMGNPCIGDGDYRTFDSQPASFIVFNRTNGQYIYFGDRWWDGAASSPYVWLPVTLNKKEHTFNLYYTLEWKHEEKWPGSAPQPVPYSVVTATPTSVPSASPSGGDDQKKESSPISYIIAVSAGSLLVIVLVVVLVVKKVRSKQDPQESYEQIQSLN